MISRDEIDATSARLGVNASSVQRDYVFGWLLAALYGESRLASQLVLKGGNALRKGYFSETRYSDDLDFAIPGRIDAGELLDVLNDACRLVQARTGVTFDLIRNRQVAHHGIDGQKAVYKYQLYFTDFHGVRNNVTVGLRLDVTEFGRMYLPAEQRQLIHPYSDQEECLVDIRVTSLEEAMADKLKCLLQRTSSFDLFDLVYSTGMNHEVRLDKSSVITTFLKKTIFETSPVSARDLLLAVPFNAMRVYWESRIACARESLLDFAIAVDRFKAELGSLFSDFQYGESGRIAFFPAELRQSIFEAGRRRTLLRVSYDGVERLVEPYSLRFKRRRDGVGQEYLYVWDRTGGWSQPGIKAMVNWKIASISTTDERFNPRFAVELSKAGEYPENGNFGSGLGHRSAALKAKPPGRYRIMCGHCNRIFERSSLSAKLGPHLDAYGNSCAGRKGFRV